MMRQSLFDEFALILLRLGAATTPSHESKPDVRLRGQPMIEAVALAQEQILTCFYGCRLFLS